MLETQRYISSFDSNTLCEIAPIILSCSLPFLKTSSVGILIIWYSDAIRRLLSTLSLPKMIRPAYFSDNCSIIGDIIRHGPHQGAQQSTTTKIFFLTNSEKFWSLISNGLFEEASSTWSEFLEDFIHGCIGVRGQENAFSSSYKLVQNNAEDFGFSGSGRPPYECYFLSQRFQNCQLLFSVGGMPVYGLLTE